MKVVVAVDGSKYGRWAVQWISSIPFAQRPLVQAIHVLDLASLSAPFIAEPSMIAFEGVHQAEVKRLKVHAERVVAETRKLLASEKIGGKVLIERGWIAPKILKHAGKGGLVALGHRGLTARDRFFWGSVSEQVTLHAPCSVLVVKQPPRAIGRIMLAVDGSKASDRALHFLLHQLKPAKRDGITVTVLHILPSFARAQAAVAEIKLTHRYADKLADAGYRVQEAYTPGDPSEEIMKMSKSRRADLIVAGSKGLSALGRFLLGSVSTKLARHSPCSILIVR